MVAFVFNIFNNVHKMFKQQYFRIKININKSCNFLGFAPDVKVWEVIFSKSGEFKQIARAFELQGHTSGVYDFGFSADSSYMATVSKDGTWKFFNTKSKLYFYCINFDYSCL